LTNPESSVLDAIDELAADEPTAVDDSPLTADDARRLTDQIRSKLDGLWDLIMEAYRRRVWVALDYPSWDVYAMTELDTGHMRVPREERAEILTSLRRAGMPVRAISSVTGLGRTTVFRELGKAGATVPDGTVVGVDGRRRPATVERDDRGPADRALSVPGAVPPDQRPPVPYYRPTRRRLSAAERAENRRIAAVAALRVRGAVPISTIAELIASETTGATSPTEAALLASAIAARWGSWTAFDNARRKANGGVER